MTLMIYLKSQDFFLNSQQPVITELRAPQESYPEHSHSFEEIIIVSSGHGTHVINEVPMKLSKNYVCFVNRKDRHLFEGVENLHLSNVLFDRSHLSMDSSLQKYIPNNTDQNGWFINESIGFQVQNIINAIDKESHSNSPESRIICQSLFNILLVELSRGRIKEISGSNEEEKTISVASYLLENYACNYSVEEIADQAEMSSKQLTNKLKALTGMSYNRYLNYVRASKALQLLKQTDKSVTEIAFDVGYQDSNYFSTKFKQIFNATPREIRLGVVAKQ